MSSVPTEINFSITPSRELGGNGLGAAVSLIDSGKRFNRDWIFRQVTHTFETGRSYAITGPNGSGKSTLLQSIAGSIQLSAGAIEYRISNIEQGMMKEEKPADPSSLIASENFYKYLSIAAPYVELIEEMTAKEFLKFHGQFKPFISSVSVDEILSIIGLENAADKQMRYYSSGMKQRVKLAQAIFSDVPVLLLDEPCTNLDKNGYGLYHALIKTYCQQKLTIVSSNDEHEMDFCDDRLNIIDYK